VTAITPGAGRSITSTTTVSTAGATGCFIFRKASFTGARLGLAPRLVAFADFATLRASRRFAEFPLRSFERFRTFDCFLRLAMIVPLVVQIKEQSVTSLQLSKRVINRQNHILIYVTDHWAAQMACGIIQ
jgi:hypothetical protein